MSDISEHALIDTASSVVQQAADSQAQSTSRISQTPPVARSIIDKSMSPFCPGLSLSACPSPSADSLRNVIIARVRAGDARETIEQDLYRDFGAAIRGAPLPEGMGLVAWVVPGLAMVLGAIFLTRWISTRRQPRYTGALPPSHEMLVPIEDAWRASDPRAEARAKADAESALLTERLNQMLKRDS